MYQIMEVAPIEKKLEEKKQALEEAKRKGETNEQNTLAMEIIQLRIQLEQKSRKIQTI
jgi:hypothetical protein